MLPSRAIRSSVGPATTPRRTAASALLAVPACFIAAGFALVLIEGAWHWALLPLLGCLYLVAADGIDWVRGRLGLFDPAGILGMLGVHFFFLAPLLHVSWDYWLFAHRWGAMIPPPSDWRPWLGGMALINFAGLIIYRIVRQQAASSGRRRALVVWQIAPTRFWPLLFLFLAATAAAQVGVYTSTGGISGYVEAYETRAFQGMGLTFMVSESFPILAMIGFAVYARKHPSARSWPVLLFVLVAYLALKLGFGGLRGSRSNTIWGMFWAAGIIHLWLRPIPRRVIAFALPVLGAFLYIYSFYKTLGSEALEALDDPTAMEEAAERKGLGAERTLLGELGRSDVQAFTLYSIMRGSSDYDLAFGRTYLGTAALAVPRAIWPTRPPTKVNESTEILYGKGTYLPGVVQSSRVHGLAGEAMLNFGPFGAPFSFILLGLLVAWVQRSLVLMEQLDARRLLFPLAANLCFVLLVGDSDNVLFFTMKNGVLPAGLLFLGCARRKLA